MARYWIDTSVFIEASNGPLAFDLQPQFWETLEADARSGLIGSPAYVYRELVELSHRDDQVAQWARRMRDAGILFDEPEDAVIDAFTQIADHVHKNTHPSEGDKFLGGADPWVIGHAMAGGTVVVSQEKGAGLGSSKVKIPNICAHFLVGCIKTDRYLREIRDVKKDGASG